MKILYALIFVCLSLHGWVGQSATSTISTSANEYSTANQLESEGMCSDEAYASSTLRLERFSATDGVIWEVSPVKTRSGCDGGGDFLGLPAERASSR